MEDDSALEELSDELWAHRDAHHDTLSCLSQAHSSWTVQPCFETRISQNKPFPSFNFICFS